MYDEVITLLNITTTTNDYGDMIETETKKDVFAQVKSIGMKETYQALSVGLKPELIFILADYYDYENQKAIEYEGERYSVIRTYRKSNELELVVTHDASTE